MLSIGLVISLILQTAVAPKYRDLVGQTTTVCGAVVAYTESNCRIQLHIDRPSWEAAFYVLIPAEAASAFPPFPEDRYLFQNICVTGVVGADGRGIPHVVATQPGQITINDARPVPTFGVEAVRSCEPEFQKPRLIKDVKPSYTADALRAKVEGAVLLDAVVGTDGKVSEVRTVVGLHPELDRSSEEVLAMWLFQPATRGGVPVPVRVQVEMTFTLRR
jgi:TonB family protein